MFETNMDKMMNFLIECHRKGVVDLDDYRDGMTDDEVIETLTQINFLVAALAVDFANSPPLKGVPETVVEFMEFCRELIKEK